MFREPGNLADRCRSSARYWGNGARGSTSGDYTRPIRGACPVVVDGCGPSTTLYRFKEQWPAVGWSWADPFPVEDGDGLSGFLEVYDHARQHGTIGVSRLTGGGAFEPPVTVLDAPYHLSYPFVFEWRGKWFMMPESSDAARIEVFSARRFPWDWTLEAVLFNPLRAVDSTLVNVEGRWWLFTNVSPHPTGPHR